MVHHRGYVHLSTHMHHTCHDASLSCCIQPYKIRMVRPSILDSRLRRPPHTQSKKGKTRLVLLHRSTSQTNVATVSVARMKLMFVRWFGRPFWTHTDVHLLVYTHCSLDGSAVHFGLTPTSTHRFLVYIQRKTRLVLLHRSASQTNGSTVSDCPNETRVHHILFQCQ